MKIQDARKKLLSNKEFKREYDKVDLSLEIAKMIIDARSVKNITQSKLAELVGTKQPSIARIESGESLPSLSFLQKIAEAMGAYLLPPKIAFTDQREVITSAKVTSSIHVGDFVFSEPNLISTSDWNLKLNTGNELSGFKKDITHLSSGVSYAN